MVKPLWTGGLAGREGGREGGRAVLLVIFLQQLTHPSFPPSLPPSPQWYTSRLGPGSGSTPSLTTCQGQDLVVLTDGELDMGLIYLDAETGE